MHTTPKQKILVIVGPTASGKTSLAVRIAQECNGEIISADSRQVYRGLDSGTEKITHEEMGGIPHHLIDCADPRETYTAFDFKNDAEKHIKEITARGHVPIIAGGTLLYIETLLGRKVVPEIPPNPVLREKLEKLSVNALFEMLKEKDPTRAKNIDAKNPRRLVRALEIVEALGTVPKETQTECPYDAYIIGLLTDADTLRDKIAQRLSQTLEKGLVEETKKVLADGLSETRLKEIGLEYRVVLEYLHGEITEEQMKQKLIEKVWQYAKRQRTWLKRMEGVRWYEASDDERIMEEVRGFLKK